VRHPASGVGPGAVSRGSRDKQPRAFDGNGRVPVLGENGAVVDVCTTTDRLAPYLAATNAEVKKRADGSIRLVRLLGGSDDRGHLGERHGRSTVTTKRVRNDWGRFVGSDQNLQHKPSSASWGSPAVQVRNA
jgi:hypothetical protein